MDEVLEKFESALETGNQEAKTNFDGLYKNWGKLGNQEERRKELLEIQKSNRNNKLDACRGIIELMGVVEQNDIFQTQRVHYEPKTYIAGFHRTALTYSNVLMLSEWMIERPADFDENWFVVPCPKGVRMLVVANQGSTKCYTKHGIFRFALSTLLPGGHRPKKSNKCCVLDCFYVEKINTMYILDLLAWNNQPMTDGEAEFRQYWLESQLAEMPDLQKISKRNEIVFKILPKTSCDQESFNKFMKTYPPFENDYPVMDGLLFYHKKAHYVSGQTPLVGWLFPYMVPEVLGHDITINGAYAIQKPVVYVDQATFIEDFETKNAKRTHKHRSGSMETDDETKNTTNKNNPVTKKGKKKKGGTGEAGIAEAEMESEEIKEESMESEAIAPVAEARNQEEVTGDKVE